MRQPRYVALSFKRTVAAVVVAFEGAAAFRVAPVEGEDMRFYCLDTERVPLLPFSPGLLP